MSDEESRDEVLTLSSVAMGISFIAFTAALGCLFASLPLIRSLFAWFDPHNAAFQQPVPREAILCCLALGLSVGALGPLMLCFSCCGTWRINTDGTEFRHLFKKRRKYLRWQVDQIHWSHLQFGLKGKDIRLVAYWHWFPKATQDQARARLQTFFLRSFDLPASTLPAPRWSFEANFSSVTAWMAKMAGIAIGITAIALGIILLAVLGPSGILSSDKR
jgi:hypothetical protein